MPITIIAWISSWLLKFYQLPNSNLFTHRMLFFLREATSEIYGPRVYSLSYLLRDLFLFAFIFRSINPKTERYLAALFYYLFYFAFPQDLFIQSTTNQSIFLPGRDWQPLLRVGLQVFVLCVQVQFIAWFPYWFDNLGHLTEGNTYRSYAASSLPLWGNTDVVQAAS